MSLTTHALLQPRCECTELYLYSASVLSWYVIWVTLYPFLLFIGLRTSAWIFLTNLIVKNKQKLIYWQNNLTENCLLSLKRSLKTPTCITKYSIYLPVTRTFVNLAVYWYSHFSKEHHHNKNGDNVCLHSGEYWFCDVQNSQAGGCWYFRGTYWIFHPKVSDTQWQCSVVSIKGFHYQTSYISGMTCVKVAKILMTWKVESKAKSLVNNNSKIFNFSKKLLCGMLWML